MKILLATYWAIPHIGGVWPLMCQIKNQLESLGHEVDIFGTCIGGSGYQIINKNWIINNKQLLQPLRTLLFRNNATIFNAQQIRRYGMELAAAYFGLEQYDIIHTHDVISTRCLYRVKPKQTPLFASIHGAIANEKIHNFQFHKPNATIEQIKKTPDWKHSWVLEKLGTHSADLIHTSSQWTKNILIRDYGVSNDRIITFPYGIKIEEFMEKMNIKTEIKKPEGKKVILYTGRLVDIKGIHFLLPALLKLKNTRRDWVCWIVGDGKMKNYLQKQSNQLGLSEFVYFLGRRNDVPALLKLSDIFVLPSLQDNMPISLIEAQLAGKAAIISNAGGLPEMAIHGKTGLIAPAGQSEPLFEHLKVLLENDSYRDMISSNTKHWALKQWSINLMIESILINYRKLTGEI